RSRALLFALLLAVVGLAACGRGSLADILDHEVAENPEAAELARWARAERASWERGEPDGAGREELRSRVCSLAERVRRSRGRDSAALLFRAASAIGTP